MFYGPARVLAPVKEALRTQAGRKSTFLLIFGMSDSRKSSLVRAGLLDALTATLPAVPADVQAALAALPRAGHRRSRPSRGGRASRVRGHSREDAP